MRLGIFLAAAIIAASSPAARAQSPAATPPAEPRAPNAWVVGEDLIVLPHARIAFPTKPAGMHITETGEFSRKGEGLDNYIQYKLEEGAVFATAYLFYPGLAHGGLSAAATHWAMEAQDPHVQLRARRIVAAGGKQGVAIRSDYARYLDRNASSAAFIKAGRWIVAVRVTGPRSRQGEVDATMQAFLDSMAFGPDSPAHPATPIEITACPSGLGKAKARLAAEPENGELPAQGFLATLDGGGIEAQDKQHGGLTFLPSRVPGDLCETRLKIGANPVLILRAAEGPSLSVDGRTMLVAVLNDAGRYLEVVHQPKLQRYLMLFHDIGQTAVLGGFESVPSDDQIRDIIQHPEQPAARIRVPVTFQPGKGPEISLPAGEPAPKSDRPVT